MKKPFILVVVSLAVFGCRNIEPANPKQKDGTVTVNISVPNPVSTKFATGGGASVVTDKLMRVKLQVWNKDAVPSIVETTQKVVNHISVSSVSFTLTLPAAEYDFLFWADYVNDNDDADLYYQTSSLKNVVKQTTNYSSDYAHDAYCGSVLDADLTDASFVFPAVQLIRPLARVEVSANDADKASASDLPTKAVVSYTTPIPVAYDVASATIVSGVTAAGVSFEFPFTFAASGTAADICFDYLFAASDNTTKLNFDVVLKNTSDMEIVSRTMTNIPIVKNKRIAVVDAFFSAASSISATSVMQSENPYAPQVTVAWNNLASTPAEITLNPVDGTYGYPAVTYTVTASDVAASKATIADYRILPGVEYTVAVTDAASVSLGERHVTGAVLPDGVTIITPATTDVRDLLVDDARNETLYVMPGTSYTITATTTLTKNLLLTAAHPSLVKINMAKNFIPSGTIDKLEFSNITFLCTGYFMQGSATNLTHDIGALTIDNCIVDLNSSATSNSSLFSSGGSTSSTRRLGKYTIKNSTVFANAGQAQNIVYIMSSGADNINRLDELCLQNSTFVNCGRGLVTIPSKIDNPCKITMSNCTLYKMSCNNGSTAIFDIRFSGSDNMTNRTIAIDNSVIHFGATTIFRWLTFNSATDFSMPTATNTYYFATQTPLYSSSAYNITSSLTSFDGMDTELWENPLANPTASGASFKIKSSSGVPATIGDQRWN